VLNLPLPAWRPNFAIVACTTSKVEEACCMLLEIVDQVDAHIRMLSHWE